MSTTALRGEKGARDEPSDDLDGRRDVLRKLAVGGAIVWATPMITSSVAAAAVSVPPATCTVNSKVDWDLSSVGATGDTFTSATVNGITMSLSSTFTGGATALSTNHKIVAPPQGGISEKALRFEQKPVNGGAQVIKVTFSKQVRSVSFSFFDIDNLSNAWSDRIVIDTTPFTYTIPNTSNVVGNGTSATPFRNSVASSNIPNTSGSGNVTVTWAGPLFVAQFQFRCASPAGGSNQLINISDISFCR